MPTAELNNIQSVIDEAIVVARNNHDGEVASYIPELASVEPEYTGVAVTLVDGHRFVGGDMTEQTTSLQSIAKLVLLIGLVEEFGPQKVFSWVKVEPSGDDFASIARLDQFGPVPSNPMLNSGAITLCSHIPGNPEERLAWLERWMERLFGEKLNVDPKVCASERRTGDRNRSLAYLLKSSGQLEGEVGDVLDTYFHLCSYEVSVTQAAYLPMLLANLGMSQEGEQMFSELTARQVVSIMATCGLYNESGQHLVRTGMPAKSGVCGCIVAVMPRVSGIAVISPRINAKGTSIRGSIILEHISQKLGWHFAG